MQEKQTGLGSGGGIDASTIPKETLVHPVFIVQIDINIIYKNMLFYQPIKASGSCK